EESLEQRREILRTSVEDIAALVLEIRPQDGLPLAGLAELDVVLLAHAFEPVETLGVDRRDGGQARDGDAPLVAESRAGEHVRPAARDAPAAVPVEPERVGDRVDVGSAIGDLPAGPARRAA